MINRRNRLVYAGVIVAVIIVGLASRSPLATYMPVLFATYAGDTLWALTVFLCLGFVLPRARMAIVASVAILIAFGVEISQLYQAEWMNRIRNTSIGALALGSGFKWSDFVCYTFGCIIGVAGELLAMTGLKSETRNPKTERS
ncbi:MAG: DUF2809 domain-containing protein [Kiritimatiellia bacterium]|jgi:hypothetical protein|nr:DUF2809 domain-containing protein [Kiritimatiellia bacterium]